MEKCKNILFENVDGNIFILNKCNNKTCEYNHYKMEYNEYKKIPDAHVIRYITEKMYNAKPDYQKESKIPYAMFEKIIDRDLILNSFNGKFKCTDYDYKNKFITKDKINEILLKNKSMEPIDLVNYTLYSPSKQDSILNLGNQHSIINYDVIKTICTFLDMKSICNLMATCFIMHKKCRNYRDNILDKIMKINPKIILTTYNCKFFYGIVPRSNSIQKRAEYNFTPVDHYTFKKRLYIKNITSEDKPKKIIVKFKTSEKNVFGKIEYDLIENNRLMYEGSYKYILDPKWNQIINKYKSKYITCCLIKNKQTIYSMVLDNHLTIINDYERKLKTISFDKSPNMYFRPFSIQIYDDQNNIINEYLTKNLNNDVEYHDKINDMVDIFQILNVKYNIEFNKCYPEKSLYQHSSENCENLSSYDYYLYQPPFDKKFVKIWQHKNHKTILQHINL